MEPRYVIPAVIESTNRGERSWDIYSRLLRDRVVFVGAPIDSQIANLVIAQLLFLDYEDPEKEIRLYINSPGGEVYAGLGIYDTMQMLKCDVSTVCMGLAASMGSVLLMAGAPGKRYALPNSRVLIHQGSGGFSGNNPDVEVQAREAIGLVTRCIEIMACHTGQSFDKVKRDTERDYFMGADEAREYGIVDEVLRPQSAALAHIR
ncbi:MAG: ATP-dependent Clp protease proteolytic subunit [Chloroflexota bacterium]|nr:ATP-dependent Clp protease proteolytic subunit [Chloroflexota bacterium]